MISKRFYYLLSLLFVFGIPTFIAGVVMRSTISWATLSVFILIVMVVGSIWDIWATRHGKKDRVWLWQFNFKDNLGIKIFGLPIEEYLFYTLASLYAVFIWQAIGLSFETKEYSFITLVITMGAWSFVSATLPYIFRKKGDRL